MRFITTVYGEKYIPFLWVHLWSIKNTHPEDKVTVLYDDIPKSEILILKVTFPNFDFEESEVHLSELDMKKRIPLKLRLWLKACETYNDDFLCLLDCDTVIIKNINTFFSNDFDILYTWKNEKFALNTGVLIFKNAKKNIQFMKLWLKETEDIISDSIKLEYACKTDGAADQHAFNRIIDTKNYDGITEKKIDKYNIVFKGVNCRFLNETNCTSITQETHIIHYKAGWHSIILEKPTFSKNRPKEECQAMFNFWVNTYITSVAEILDSFIISSTKKYLHQFKKIAKGFEERGILNSEMLLVCAMIATMKIGLIIESGRYKGRSTEILAKFFHDTDIEIISIELLRDENADYVEKKLKGFKNIKLLYGDSNRIIPKIIRNEKRNKIAILFDGPKGEEAINIFKRALSINKNISLGFFHDMRKSSESLPNPSRKIIENSIFDRIYFTDDNEFVNNFMDLDLSIIKDNNTITEHSWRPWMKGHKSSNSYGPTVAVVIPFYKEIIALTNHVYSLFILLRNAYNCVKIKLPPTGLNFLLKLNNRIPQSLKEKWRFESKK